MKSTEKIKIEKIDQEIPRKIKYLSYPFNYGIIPQTILTTEEGGDGDALDVVLLGEKLKRGSIEEIIILGALNFIDSGDNDLKIIAINESSIIFKNIKNFDDLENNYNGVLDIIKLWFLNYKGQNRVYYDKTLDVNETKQIIEKAHKNFKFYLNNLEQNCFSATRETAPILNKYCQNQKMNPHLHRSMLTMGISETDKDAYINNVLFEEI